MEDKKAEGWHSFMTGYPWFRCHRCYPIVAYSEFMPSPGVGCKPYGRPDHLLIKEEDPYGWNISELEEEYELRPGIEHIGKQVMDSIIKLGKGSLEHFIHGHGGENLINNPYLPPELSKAAGSLSHERYVVLLPLMLSRTQDDKGRVIWTFFGNSIHSPGKSFWKSFFNNPGSEVDRAESVSFFIDLLTEAYNEKLTGEDSLFRSGFRILPSADEALPSWTDKYIIDDKASFEGTRYLLTFRPFSSLSQKLKSKYLSGELSLLPFPGSLVFWGMPGYLKLKAKHPVTAQIPLLNLVARNRGLAGMRVNQSGWFHEPHPDTRDLVINEHLLHDDYHRTHRWEKIHRYQDELNELAHKIRLIKALFSTEPEAMGLYNKPLARNSQIWTSSFDLLLDGPSADHNRLTEVEKILSHGGLFGYRFFFPPMCFGKHSLYLHRPLVAYLPEKSENIVIKSESLYGYITAYHSSDKYMSEPVELWPRMLKRDLYLSALNEFGNLTDHYSHQTSLNIISLLESQELLSTKKLVRSFAHHLLNVAKHKSLEDWIAELEHHAVNHLNASLVKRTLEDIIEKEDTILPESLTYRYTANRAFEEAWWNDIRYLSTGEFVYKDNADIMMDETTLGLVKREQRDLELLGDYLINRYHKMISESAMKGKAVVGELPFKWETLFDFMQYGGWVGNQDGSHHERNILVIIPGRNRGQAVVLCDHYDTAYMEDIYEKERGGSGARLSARGADDNYSASSTLLQAAHVFIELSKEGKLERDVWLLHLTGEEFPSDCMGARNFCQKVIENELFLKTEEGYEMDLSSTEIVGVYIMDMIGHNRDNGQDIFQISPGKCPASMELALQAHIANMIWNKGTSDWNKTPERINAERGRRIIGGMDIPAVARHPQLKGEVRTRHNPHSSIYNTDGQIFSDTGIPVVLFMENYDINRSGYHDSMDTLENIDLDYGSALAAIAIETVARIATLTSIAF
jgi:hypothetical protein